MDVTYSNFSVFLKETTSSYHTILSKFADGNNILVMAEYYQDIFISDLMMTYSSDGGNTWSDILGFFETESKETKPVVDFCGNNEFQAYGTCLPDYNTKILYLIHFPSMTDPEVYWKDSEGWTLWSMTWDEWNDFYSIDIAGYPHGDNAPASDFHGIITMIGEGSGADEIENVYETQDNGVGACFLEFTGDLGDTLTVDIDISEERYFEAMEISNDPDLGLEESYGVFYEYCWVEPGNENWWENDWPAMVIEHASNPDLAADGGNCYLICEYDGGIVCYYSSDAGENFESSTISASGTFPTVSIVETTVVCSYFRNGNLYTSTSENGGQSWEENIVNDVEGSAVEESHSADVASNYVTWTDDRNGNNVVYFDKAGEVSIPIIEIGTISGGMGVTAVIKNVGTADATNVDYSIEATGGILSMINKQESGTISSLAVGAQETIKLPMLIGLGKVSITVTAGSASETVEGTQILVYTMI